MGSLDHVVEKWLTEIIKVLEDINKHGYNTNGEGINYKSLSFAIECFTEKGYDFQRLVDFTKRFYDTLVSMRDHEKDAIRNLRLSMSAAAVEGLLECLIDINPIISSSSRMENSLKDRTFVRESLECLFKSICNVWLWRTLMEADLAKTTKAKEDGTSAGVKQAYAEIYNRYSYLRYTSHPLYTV